MCINMFFLGGVGGGLTVVEEKVENVNEIWIHVSIEHHHHMSGYSDSDWMNTTRFIH